MTFDFWSGLLIGTTIGVIMTVVISLKVFGIKIKDLLK